MISTKTDQLREFRAPQTMTTEELGDTLARLVWESFSDFLAREDMGTPLPTGALLPDDDGTPDDHAAEEALIFFMWAHTRGAQLAFHGRIPDRTIRKGLDALHRAVFEDMVLHGTPRAQLPLFEQRVSARYAEYHQAAAESDGRLGGAGCRHFAGPAAHCREIAEALTERAVSVAHPLRDFLEEVELLD
ncbi:MAG: hypothetical protein FIA95_12540 [Gemmatimonadetes bacterium]|nr:hypothetical protein [Gemmatimonadota bacterium]